MSLVVRAKHQFVNLFELIIIPLIIRNLTIRANHAFIHCQKKIVVPLAEHFESLCEFRVRVICVYRVKTALISLT